MPPEISILIVDDNRGDALLLTRALHAAFGDAAIDAATSGEQALQRLRCEAEFAGCPLPALVLLDCRLPRLSGFQVLKAVRTDASFNNVRIVLMSGVVTPEHLDDGHKSGADGHLQKPETMDEFDALARALAGFVRGQSRPPFRFPAGLPYCF